DSRAVQPGQAFFAIRGQRLDGHDFLEEAALRGATLLVVDDRARAARALAELASPPATLLVPDARRALGAIAAARRASTLACAQLVAVTGSNGKTTTCRMLEAALAAAAPTHASPRSFNNDIGLPLTLLNAPAQSVFLVCEIGANAPGEIAQLGAIATPDVAVALNASLAHTEGFGDRAGVVREKASLAACVRAGGAVVAPAQDSELLAAVRKRAPSDARIVTVGDAPGADAQLLCAAQRLVEEKGQLRPQLTAALADGAELTLPLAGRHNALNACFALAAARALGVEDQTACAAMKGMAPAPMRLAFSRVGGVLLCNDAYNANPASTLAAIETFLELTTQAAQRTL
ncbi:MAG: UDP-N-acetylmuramoyl-tripeptide--D-alanyl-D-alanine ligase, partial [Gammaproteobacteria bacterium]